MRHKLASPASRAVVLCKTYNLYVWSVQLNSFSFSIPTNEFIQIYKHFSLLSGSWSRRWEEAGAKNPHLYDIFHLPHVWDVYVYAPMHNHICRYISLVSPSRADEAVVASLPVGGRKKVGFAARGEHVVGRHPRQSSARSAISPWRQAGCVAIAWNLDKFRSLVTSVCSGDTPINIEASLNMLHNDYRRHATSHESNRKRRNESL